MHTPQSLADVLERDYFPMPDGAKLYLNEHEWRMVIDALRASPGEAEGGTIHLTVEEVSSWLTEESAMLHPADDFEGPRLTLITAISEAAIRYLRGRSERPDGK